MITLDKNDVTISHIDTFTDSGKIYHHKIILNLTPLQLSKYNRYVKSKSENLEYPIYRKLFFQPLHIGDNYINQNTYREIVTFFNIKTPELKNENTIIQIKIK